MKILYGVCTVGQGHINRANVIVEQLQEEGHEVHILFSGPKPPKYAYNIGDRHFHSIGYELVGTLKGLHAGKTFVKNFSRIFHYANTVIKFMKLIYYEKYDGVISDFDMISSFAGFLMYLPVIVVNHQHSIIHPGASRPKGKFFDLINTLFSIFITTPYNTHIFTLDFVNKPTYWESTQMFITLFPLINKSELKNYKISVNDHYIVYLHTVSASQLKEILTQFPNENFHIYGFNKEVKYKNLQYKKTDRERFLEDLATCKGVISHSGFSLAWEILQFKKPFLTIPIKNHYEQYVNSHRLNKLKLAIIGESFNTDEIKDFINYSRQENYKIQNKITIVDPSKLTKEIIEEIKPGRKFVWHNSIFIFPLICVLIKKILTPKK